jgi:hypothetical protein
MNNNNNKVNKLWEELITYFPLVQHGQLVLQKENKEDGKCK